MENPWIQIPEESPFVLPCDMGIINAFNSQKRNTPFEIILDEIPSPYIGDPESPVVFLNLNPGYSPEESRSPKISLFREVARANMLHRFFDYPFYVLDPSLKGTPSGYEWFSQKFGPLLHAARVRGMNPMDVSKKIFLVEYFPYKSQRCAPKWKGDTLPSQKYAISLVEKAIIRQATVVIMRSEKPWLNAAPSLRNYPNRYTLHSPQEVTISEKNLGWKGFQSVIESLERGNVILR
jgi:hypothetical protein